MTGTSLDGIDAALVEIDGDAVENLSWRLVRAITTPHPEERKERIHAGIVAGDAPSLCSLHADLGEWLAEAVQEVCRDAGVTLEEVDLVGSHGQTVWHAPPVDGRRG